MNVGRNDMKPEVAPEVERAILDERKKLIELSAQYSALVEEIRRILGPKRNKLPKADPSYDTYIKLRRERDEIEPALAACRDKLKGLVAPLQREESQQEFRLRMLSSGEVMSLRYPTMRSAITGRAISVDPRDDA